MMFSHKLASIAIFMAACPAIRGAAMPVKLMSFEPNRGQFEKHVLYGARARDYAVLVESRQIRIRLARGSQEFTLSFAGADGHSSPAATDELPGKSTYVMGNDPKHWIRSVPSFKKIRYPQLYPGIDLVLYGTDRNLEYDLIVGPGATPQRFGLRLSGGTGRITPEGDLIAGSPGEGFVIGKPLAYQTIGGFKRAIPASYSREASQIFRFNVGSYDHSVALVIDPVLSYSSFIGGALDDSVSVIAIDRAGNQYIAGMTESSPSPWFPVALNIRTYPPAVGNPVIFVMKLDPSGRTILYSTYIGGDSYNYVSGIAVDGAGNAYITGSTFSSRFPTTPGAFESSAPAKGSNPGQGYYAFVSKLNAAGDSLIYSTYLDGSGSDRAFGIAVDAAGSAYVTGATTSSDFPVTAGALQTKMHGSASPFVTKIAPEGRSLIYSSFLGSEGGTGTGEAIQIDSGGNAVVVGSTDSQNFPITAGAPQPQKDAYSHDCFVSKLNQTGSALIFSTFLGGAAEDECTAVALDSADNVYVTGVTDGYLFPTTAGAPKRWTSPAMRDAFAAKFNNTGTALVFSTLLGGSYDDYGYAIAVDRGGNAWIAGKTQSNDFPVTSDALQLERGGTEYWSDGFVVNLDATGTRLLYSTYFGGGGWNSISGIALDANQNVYLAGSAGAADFQTTRNAFRAFGPQQADGFLARLSPGACSFSLMPADPFTHTPSMTIGTSSQFVSAHVDTSPNCNWTAQRLPSWLSVVAGIPGQGAGDVTLAVDQNNGPDRSASFLLAGRPFTIHQAGSCVYSVTITNQTFPSTGSGGETISVQTAGGCAWNTFTDSSWIALSDSAMRSQGGTNGFLVLANTSPQSRTGHIYVAGWTFTITQGGGTSCGYSLLTDRMSLGPAPGSGNIYVKTTAGCPWSGSTAASWIAVPPDTQTGPGTLPFTVAANTGSDRTAAITLAGMTFTVTQLGPGPAPSAKLGFYPVTPCRIADTRSFGGFGGAYGPPALSGGLVRDIPIASPSCGIPASAQAYSLNITVVPGRKLSYLTVWPAGQSQPYVSTLNALDGRVVANSVIVPAGLNGAISLYATDDTHVIIDVNGYFAPPDSSALVFYPMTPCRVFDTRSFGGFTGAFGPPSMPALSSRTIPVVSSACQIPALAQAYSVNVTAVPPGPMMYVSAYPTGTTRPLVSTLNSFDGDVVANGAIVPAGDSGSIDVFAADATDVFVDINGYFAPAGNPRGLYYYAAKPCRVSDTRSWAGFAGAFGAPAMAGNSSRVVPISAGSCAIPSAAQAYAVNMTVVPFATLSWLTTWPGGQPMPKASTLNSFRGKIVANAAIVPAGTGGGIGIFVSDAADVIVDVNGYFAP